MDEAVQDREVLTPPRKKVRAEAHASDAMRVVPLSPMLIRNEGAANMLRQGISPATGNAVVLAYMIPSGP